MDSDCYISLRIAIKDSKLLCNYDWADIDTNWTDNIFSEKITEYITDIKIQI